MLNLSLPFKAGPVKQIRRQSVKILLPNTNDMAENADNRSNVHSAFDPLIQTENIAFGSDELVLCPACKRNNPPNRFKCMYCAAELEIAADRAASINLALRKLELWERGFNLIATGKMEAVKLEIGGVAGMLSLEAWELSEIMEAGVPLPLARVESETIASVLRSRLQESGIECDTVSDAALSPDSPPVRLKALSFEDEYIGLQSFNTGEVVKVALADVTIAVTGLIEEVRVDAIKKKRRRGNTKVLDESATTSDESVLDIYTRLDPVGFRVQLAGFDFSCLGEHKSLLARENLQRLILAIRDHAPETIWVEDYPQVRPLLGAVWALESRREPKGIVRSGFGKREFGSVESTSNLNQFTKYSRLQWQLYEGKK